MSIKTKRALGTYARALVACVIASVVAVGVSPLDFTKADLVKIANAVWVSFLPVILRALNPKDVSYGIGA